MQKTHRPNIWWTLRNFCWRSENISRCAAPSTFKTLTIPSVTIKPSTLSIVQSQAFIMAHDRISDKTAATDDPFINSLISKCSPAPYDQVIFLSQKTINDAFANMWALADPTSPIRSIDITTRDQETIKGKLKPPTVIINVVDADTMIYFQWNFESGSMTLFTTDNPNDPTTKTFDVSNWTVAFSTKLSKHFSRYTWRIFF